MQTLTPVQHIRSDECPCQPVYLRFRNNTVLLWHFEDAPAQFLRDDFGPLQIIWRSEEQTRA